MSLLELRNCGLGRRPVVAVDRSGGVAELRQRPLERPHLRPTVAGRQRGCRRLDSRRRRRRGRRPHGCRPCSGVFAGAREDSGKCERYQEQDEQEGADDQGLPRRVRGEGRPPCRGRRGASKPVVRRRQHAIFGSRLVRRNGLTATWTLRARGLRLGEPVVELGIAPLVAFRNPT